MGYIHLPVSLTGLCINDGEQGRLQLEVNRLFDLLMRSETSQVGPAQNLLGLPLDEGVNDFPLSHCMTLGAVNTQTSSIEQFRDEKANDSWKSLNGQIVTLQGEAGRSIFSRR